MVPRHLVQNSEPTTNSHLLGTNISEPLHASFDFFLLAEPFLPSQSRDFAYDEIVPVDRCNPLNIGSKLHHPPTTHLLVMMPLSRVGCMFVRLWSANCTYGPSNIEVRGKQELLL